MKPSSSYVITPELDRASAAVADAVALCKRLNDQLGATASQIKALEAEVEQLTAERATAEAALALADGDEVKALDKAALRLDTDLGVKERELRRLRARIAALEVEGPKLHEAVRLRAQELDVELGLWSNAAAAALTPEVEAAAKQLAVVIEKAHAIGGQTMRDFTDAAYVPRPSGFIRQRVNGGWYNAGANLLEPSQGLGPDAAEIQSLISPIRQAAVNGKVYPDYVPLARRPGPYVRKGIEVRQGGTPAPAADPAQQ
ncbi:hypothetical protein [Variovorax atrisoli]|uniref:hypothetical protein n=1 Tax=Variovorax atrisoli TaxID=3394203 RepID=UPI0016193E0D|nr:hypothetical protein [Variovorax sp. BK613]MBB3637156.1 hypothetical protein [Variovorax sp. BK613]